MLDLKLEHEKEIEDLNSERVKEKLQNKKLKEHIEHSTKETTEKDVKQQKIICEMKKKIKQLE